MGQQHRFYTGRCGKCCGTGKYMEISGKGGRRRRRGVFNLLCADCPVRRIPGHAGRAFHRAQHPEKCSGRFPPAEPALELCRGHRGPDCGWNHVLLQCSGRMGDEIHCGVPYRGGFQCLWKRQQQIFRLFCRFYITARRTASLGRRLPPSVYLRGCAGRIRRN